MWCFAELHYNVGERDKDSEKDGYIVRDIIAMMQAFVRRMVDWLVVFVVIALLLWFIITGPVLLLKDKDPVLSADPVVLKEHVVQLSDTLSPRMADFDGHRPAAHYIRKIFQQHTKAKFQAFVTGVGSFSNVIASYGPDSKEVVVIGAHYDAEESVPGADDNASGVAGLLELARMLAKVKDSLPIRVELVAYALGDGMYFGTREMGSFYHAEQLKKRRKDVVLMMALDSIGYFSKEKGSQRYPYKFLKLLYPEVGDFVQISGRWQDVLSVRQVKYSFSKIGRLKVRSLNVPEVFPNLAESDHQSYWLHGYSGVMVSDTLNDRNPAYRTDHDVADNLDYDTMARVTQGVYQSIMDVTKKYSE